MLNFGERHLCCPGKFSTDKAEAVEVFSELAWMCLAARNTRDFATTGLELTSPWMLWRLQLIDMPRYPADTIEWLSEWFETGRRTDCTL